MLPTRPSAHRAAAISAPDTERVHLTKARARQAAMPVRIAFAAWYFIAM
jgi:hypothetical protein